MPKKYKHKAWLPAADTLYYTVMNRSQIIANRFSLGQLIGQGGMGHVYKGHDLQTNQPVAIKVLKPVLTNASNLLERFAREGEALSRLNHPNIVKILGTINEKGHHYIVMEFVSGGSLRDLIDKVGSLPIDRVLSISLELADALTRAHHLKIIHRDLKPGNVLLAEDGTPRLTDFGIAYMGDRTRITHEGALTGTYAYLSPELCNGELLDGRSDIWSLGVLMYEMLTGQRPFAGKNGPAILMSIMSQSVPDLMQYRSDIPVSLTDLIYRMLAKDRQQRPASVRLVGATLEAIMQGINASTPTPAMPLSVEPTTTPVAIQSQTPVKHNLPADPTPFLGRDQELTEVKKRLLAPDCRLLTILGQGGIGKTRLAIQAGLQLLPRFNDGVYLIPFAFISGGDFLVSTIAEHIGLSFYHANEVNQHSKPPQVQLFEYLRFKELLLIIDSFEHLLNGADLLSDILAHAPGVKILVTSRERLNLQTEWVYRLYGMSYPPLRTANETVVDFAAVQLFVQAAQRINDLFELTLLNQSTVIHICRLVEGMPLALELAAAWVEMLSPDEILAELQQGIDFLETSLRDVPARHRSLHAVFEHSWNSLMRREQNVLPRLSVFHGGFDREAAAEIADASLPVLSALVSKSLLRRVSTTTKNGRSKPIRYELHSLLRQFAAEKLNHITAIHQHTRDRHCNFYALFLQAREGRYDGPKRHQTLDEIETEIENVRVAWRWALDQHNYDVLQQCQLGLGRFYRFRNWAEEGAEVFGRAAQALVMNDGQELLRGRFLVWAAEFSLNISRTDKPRRLLEEAIALFRRHEALIDEARALLVLGNYYGRNGDFDKAIEAIEASLALVQSLGNQRYIALCLAQLGRFANERGEFDKSLQLYQESLAICRQIEFAFGLAATLDVLGFIAYRRSDYEATERYAYECLDVYQQLGSQVGVARSKRLLAMAASLRKDYVRARQLNQESLDIYEALGHQAGAATLYSNLSHVNIFLGNYEAAKEAARISLQMAHENNNLWLAPYAESNLARACIGLGEYQLARHHLLAGLALSWRMKAIPLMLDALIDLATIWYHDGRAKEALSWLILLENHPSLVPERDDEIEYLKTTISFKLSPTETETAVARGHALTLEEIVPSLLSEAQ